VPIPVYVDAFGLPVIQDAVFGRIQVSGPDNFIAAAGGGPIRDVVVPPARRADGASFISGGLAQGITKSEGVNRAARDLVSDLEDWMVLCLVDDRVVGWWQLALNIRADRRDALLIGEEQGYAAGCRYRIGSAGGIGSADKRDSETVILEAWGSEGKIGNPNPA